MQIIEYDITNEIGDHYLNLITHIYYLQGRLYTSLLFIKDNFRPKKSIIPPFPIKVKTHGAHFNQDHNCSTTISLPVQVPPKY